VKHQALKPPGGSGYLLGLSNTNYFKRDKAYVNLGLYVSRITALARKASVARNLSICLYPGPRRPGEGYLTPLLDTYAELSLPGPKPCSC
jgi:hypothetical protein